MHSLEVRVSSISITTSVLFGHCGLFRLRNQFFRNYRKKIMRTLQKVLFHFEKFFIIINNKCDITIIRQTCSISKYIGLHWSNKSVKNKAEVIVFVFWGKCSPTTVISLLVTSVERPSLTQSRL